MTFGRWNRAPPLWYWFTRMQQRALRHGIVCDFPHNVEGYEAFVQAIGPIPEGMQSPTVGRYDHEKGYVSGNFRWQEKSENSSECAARIGLPRLGGKGVARSPGRNSLRIVVCPHCQKSGRLPPMRRWHFDRCKS